MAEQGTAGPPGLRPAGAGLGTAAMGAVAVSVVAALLLWLSAFHTTPFEAWVFVGLALLVLLGMPIGFGLGLVGRQQSRSRSDRVMGTAAMTVAGLIMGIGFLGAVVLTVLVVGGLSNLDLKNNAP